MGFARAQSRGFVDTTRAQKASDISDFFGFCGPYYARANDPKFATNWREWQPIKRARDGILHLLLLGPLCGFAWLPVHLAS